MRERRLAEWRAHLAYATKAARRFRKRLRGRNIEHYSDTPFGALQNSSVELPAKLCDRLKVLVWQEFSIPERFRRRRVGESKLILVKAQKLRCRKIVFSY